VRKIFRDDDDITLHGSSTPEGQQPKMLGCQHWSGEPEARRGSLCR